MLRQSPSTQEPLPSRKVLSLLARSSRYVRIYLGEIDVDWRHYTVPKWVVILPNSKKQPVNWSSAAHQKYDVDWTGRLIGGDGFLEGPYEQYQYPEDSGALITKYENMHPSFTTFDPMPPDMQRTLNTAREWKLRFCNPHTFLGQTQQAAVDYFLGEDNIDFAPPKLLDPKIGCRFLEVMVEIYPIFCSLIEVCELDSLLLLMSLSKHIRRRILDTSTFWKEINVTAYVVNRLHRIHRDYRFDTVSEFFPGRAGKWSGSPIHVLSGLKKHQPTSHWLLRSNQISYDEKILSSLPLASLTKLTLDGSDIHWLCWYQILNAVLPQLTFLSVRWCRNFSLGIIIFDVLGHYLEEARQRRPVRLKPSRPCNLKTLLVWGVRGEGPHNSRRFNEPRDRDIQVLHDSAGSSRFRTNGNGIKALYIQYCQALGIKTDFGICSATSVCCWNEIYIKEGNFDYGMVDAENTSIIVGGDSEMADVEPKFAAPGYLATRSCSRCCKSKETHLCRECEESRTCYICLRYVCMDCDGVMSFATRPLDWRFVRSKTALPEYLPQKYCVSNCCNYCTNAGRYVCVECNFQAQAEARHLLLSNCSGCTCNHMPEDFCPIRIPIDTQSERHGKKHLTVCGMNDCGNLIVACRNCDNGKDVMDYGQRCSACAIPVCWTCARTPCPQCPIAYDRLCPKCVIQHTCTCYHTVRRTSRRKKGKGKATENDEAKPSSRKTHQPGCPLKDIQTHAETPLTTTLRYHDKYILPGGEVRTERGYMDNMNHTIRCYPKVKLEPACDDCGIAWWTSPRYDDLPVRRRRKIFR
ncbi:hypothetical protein H072_5278 [Dactylellina haptotyla CBS 200.50]|uniref:Uncharacterized protein n=1 Tax=Dactylellina haptotyla (strain CBS 200.50) TaxID=1284197 RepID=S8BZX4_DACHA|nr:hypothetical protein H072_5278 [Dactylellina haptotyla CBS 200.50]